MREVLDDRTAFRQGTIEPELAECEHRVRGDGERAADCDQAVQPLEDDRLDAGLPERSSRRQAADAGADDEDSRLVLAHAQPAGGRSGWSRAIPGSPRLDRTI